MNSLTENIPLVSICCTCYNHEKYIRDALEGFLMQKTTFPFEIVVFDDASTDTSQQIILEYAENYPNLFRLFLQKENLWQNKGISGALTVSFPNARGKYIAWCEGDDYWTDPYKLQKQVDILEQDTEEKLIGVVTNSSVCNHLGEEIQAKRNVVPNNKAGAYTLRDFLKDEHLYPTLTLLFRNKNMERVFEKMERLKNPFLGDWTLEVVLLLEGNFYYLDEVTAAYRKNPASVTHTQNHILRWKENFSICEKVKKEVPSCFHKYLYTKSKGYWKLSFAYRKQHDYWHFVYCQFRSFVANPPDYFRRLRKDVFKIK